MFKKLEPGEVVIINSEAREKMRDDYEKLDPELQRIADAFPIGSIRICDCGCDSVDFPTIPSRRNGIPGMTFSKACPWDSAIPNFISALSSGWVPINVAEMKIMSIEEYEKLVGSKGKNESGTMN